MVRSAVRCSPVPGALLRRSPALVVLFAVAVGACAHTGARPTSAVFTSANPFSSASPLPDQAPPFDRIHDSDYQPAIEAGMRQHLIEIGSIAAQTAEPTFENTVVAMERSGSLLTRASKTFGAVNGANTDDTLDRVQNEEAPKLAEHADAIFLNAKLFARVKSLYDRRDALGLDPEQRFLVERYYRNFVRAGAQLSAADQTRLRALNKEEAQLGAAFHTKLLAGTKAGALVFTDKTQMDGLSAEDVAASAEAAKERGLAGKWVLPLQNTTRQPAQQSLKDRAVRERLFVASTTRTEHGDTNDTRSTVKRLAQLRAERAKLLGFPTFAAFSLDDQMAKTPEAAIKLLSDLAPAVNAKASIEAADMQTLIDAQHGGFQLAPWDWLYYAEQVRKARYDLDESQIKPYFELDRVLHDGVFFAANKLYGLTFKERHDLPVYQPDVRVFEVFDADGKSLALWYCDYFKRDAKSGGAWEDTFVDQSALLGNKAVVYNVANFTKPPAGQPALLSYNDVTTMFHEFGHGLHAMFSHVTYPTFSGTNVSRDFVEFPSQFNEHWALDSTVLANYAHHYQTGAPMPRELVEKIKRSHTFNQGFETSEYVQASLLDLAWHTLPPGAPLQDVDTFEKDALARYHVALAAVPPRYRTTYFSHIWDGGYSAGYYAYLWSEVLDHDAFGWFKEHGGLTRENGQRFRDLVLSRGGTQDAAALFRNFRGRDPIVEPLLEERGLKTPTTQ